MSKEHARRPGVESLPVLTPVLRETIMSLVPADGPALFVINPNSTAAVTRGIDAWPSRIR